MIILHALVLPFIGYYFNHGRWPLSCANKCHIHRQSCIISRIRF